METTTEVAPVETPVITPLALTVAILVSLDLKVRDWEAVEGATLPVMVLAGTRLEHHIVGVQEMDWGSRRCCRWRRP